MKEAPSPFSFFCCLLLSCIYFPIPYLLEAPPGPACRFFFSGYIDDCPLGPETSSPTEKRSLGFPFLVPAISPFSRCWLDRYSRPFRPKMVLSDPLQPSGNTRVQLSLGPRNISFYVFSPLSLRRPLFLTLTFDPGLNYSLSHISVRTSGMTPLFLNVKNVLRLHSTLICLFSQPCFFFSNISFFSFSGLPRP